MTTTQLRHLSFSLFFVSIGLSACASRTDVSGTESDDDDDDDDDENDDNDDTASASGELTPSADETMTVSIPTGNETSEPQEDDTTTGNEGSASEENSTTGDETSSADTTSSSEEDACATQPTSGAFSPCLDDPMVCSTPICFQLSNASDEVVDGFCTEECTDDSSCKGLGECTAVATCMQGTDSKICVLACTGGKTCPEGMKCQGLAVEMGQDPISVCI